MNNLLILSTQGLPEGRVFGLDAQTLVQIGLQLFNGIILAILLTYILYKPVKEFLQKRTERIQTSRDEAEKTMAKAKDLIAEYEAKLENIEQERLRILEKAQEEAHAQKTIIMAETKGEADKLKQQAIERIEADKKRLHQESRLQIIELSSLIAEKYLVKNLDTESQEKYMEEMIAQLEETSWTN